MKLNPKQRRAIIASINVAIKDHNDDPHPETLRRISRMISNLNGATWPE